jgi:hypothetical protein
MNIRVLHGRVGNVGDFIVPIGTVTFGGLIGDVRPDNQKDGP